MSAQSTQRHWQENSHQYHQLHLAGAGEEPAAPACRQTFAVLQEHPSRQNSVAPVRAQQGWWAAVQRAEHGGLYAQPMPCNHQQRTECGWHQGYPFVSDCYVLVGTSCSRSTRISRALHLPTQGPRVGNRGKNSISWVGSRLPRQTREKRARGTGGGVRSSRSSCSHRN